MSAPSRSSTGSKLIARIWHGVTAAARADEYADYLERTGARECRATPGNRGVYVLRRIKQGRAEFTFISRRVALSAIRRFARDDADQAHSSPEARDSRASPATYVEHAAGFPGGYPAPR